MCTNVRRWSLLRIRSSIRRRSRLRLGDCWLSLKLAAVLHEFHVPAKRLRSSLTARVHEDDSPPRGQERLDIGFRGPKSFGCDGSEICGGVFDDPDRSRRVSTVKPLLERRP